MARPSRGSDDHVKWRSRRKIVSPISTFVLNTLTLTNEVPCSFFEVEALYIKKGTRMEKWLFFRLREFPHKNRIWTFNFNFIFIEIIVCNNLVMTTRHSIQYLAVVSSDALPLSNRRLVVAMIIKLGFRGKYPTCCYWNVDRWHVLNERSDCCNYEIP